MRANAYVAPILVTYVYIYIYASKAFFHETRVVP